MSIVTVKFVHFSSDELTVKKKKYTKYRKNTSFKEDQVQLGDVNQSTQTTCCVQTYTNHMNICVEVYYSHDFRTKVVFTNLVLFPHLLKLILRKNLNENINMNKNI